MNPINYETLGLDELRRYVLTNREDTQAFYVYIDRSKSKRKMISVDLEDRYWEEKINTQKPGDRS